MCVCSHRIQCRDCHIQKPQVSGYRMYILHVCTFCHTSIPHTRILSYSFFHSAYAHASIPHTLTLPFHIHLYFNSPTHSYFHSPILIPPYTHTLISHTLILSFPHTPILPYVHTLILPFPYAHIYPHSPIPPVWDLGGQTSIRPYWRCYYANTDAIIYVVDSADRDRLAISKSELVSMLEVHHHTRTHTHTHTHTRARTHAQAGHTHAHTS